jgi:site-specific DNA-cytosine methylase
LRPGEITVDNFAGGGGASTGIEAALGRPIDYVISPDYNGKPITKTAQTRLAGNSVVPQLAEALVAANARGVVLGASAARSRAAREKA